MIQKAVLIGLFIASVYSAEYETTFENSNFTLSMPLDGTGSQELYNYNRFRMTTHISEKDWFMTAIGDLQNHLGYAMIHSESFQSADAKRSDTPFETRTGSYDYSEGEMYLRLYRLYGGYADEKHRITLGLQKVSMGVGRIWNPTDLFNPKNPFALEPDEVNGVLALAYTYSPSALSQMSVVSAMRADDSFKYAGRIKGYVGLADAAINAVEANDVRMIGYELEGEWMNTGIELRSEGGWFEDKLLQKQFFQGIFGADYTFENTLGIAVEWLHSSKTFVEQQIVALPSGAPDNLVQSSDYAGISAGYEFDPLWYGRWVSILNLDDRSIYFSPSLHYSLDNDMSLGLGAMLFTGDHGSEFGDFGPTYYLNFKVTF